MGKETRQGVRGKLEKIGGKLSSSEHGKLKDKFDVSGKFIRQEARKEGIRLPGQSRADLPGYGSAEAESDAAINGMYPNVFDYTGANNLLVTQGNIDTQIANLNSDASKYITQLQVDSAKDVAGIQTKGAIDLQGIVNAGMENVENIRGGYGIKGKKIDQKTAILGNLVSAFNF